MYKHVITFVGSSPCKVRPNKRKSKIPTSTRSNGTSKLVSAEFKARQVKRLEYSIGRELVLRQ